jgi:tetratricopeptide (TPR) repeat protein
MMNGMQLLPIRIEDSPINGWYLVNTSSPAVQLCIQGTQAEYQGRLAEAKALYEQAWNLARNNVERCIVAHYVARFQDTPEARLHWNQEALHQANAADHEQVKDFYPSLYLNLGQSYEQLRNQAEADHYYALAADLGANHQTFSK